MAKKDNTATYAAWAIVLFWLLMAYGWCANVYKVCGINFSDGIEGMEILRIVGTFLAPLGVVLGFI